MRVYPCISCLEPLTEDTRFALVLASKAWWEKLCPTGNWCRPCAIASRMKRNLRLLDLERRRAKWKK